MAATSEYTFEVPGSNSPTNTQVVNSIIATGTIGVTRAGTFTNTGYYPTISVSVGGLTPTAGRLLGQAAGSYAEWGIASAIAIPSWATTAEGDAFFGSAVNYCPAAAGVAFVGYGVSGASGAIIFGANMLVGDTLPGGSPNASGVVGCEFDMGGFNLGSVVLGLNVKGAFPNGVIGTASAYQLDASSYPWTSAFLSFEGAAESGLYLGALGSSANTDGQPITLAARDGSAVIRSVTVSALHTSNNALLEIEGAMSCNAQTVTQGLATFAAATAITANASNILEAYFSQIGAAVGSVTTDGTGVTYGTLSDHRTKVLTGKSDGSIIDALEVHTGTVLGSDPRSFFLAHDLQVHVPHAVSGKKDAVYTEDVLGVVSVKIHSKGDIYTADVEVNEPGVIHHKGELYTRNTRAWGPNGPVLHNVGDPYLSDERGMVKVVKHKKGDVYQEDIYERREMIVHKKGDPIYQHVDHSAVVPDIVAYIQTLRAEINELKAARK